MFPAIVQQRADSSWRITVRAAEEKEEQMDKYDMVMDTNPEGVIGKFIRKIRKNSTVLEFGCAFG